MANSISNLFSKLLKRDDPQVAAEQENSMDDLRKEPRLAADSAIRIEWFDEGGVCRSEPAAILDSSIHGMAFTVTEELPVDQTLWVETGSGAVTKTVVRNASPSARGFRIGAYRVDKERRRTDRFPAGGNASIHWGDPQVGPCDTPVLVRNATEYGLQVECSVPIPVGTIVQVQGDELQCDGSTCYCREYGDGFVIGLHLVRKAYSRNTLDYRDD